MRFKRFTMAARLVIIAAATSTLPAIAHASPPGSCATLAGLVLPDTTITAAEEVGAGNYTLPSGPLARLASLPGMNVAGHVQEKANPAFCRVAATLRPTADSDIKIEVWLPIKHWNGKFLGVANFGWAGTLMTSGMLSGLAEGYATASTDTGHDSSMPDGDGGEFALGHPEKLIDYAYRADHLMTVEAKAIIEAFYGKAPERSYWIGCSLGGLEGLIEAKRYPADYDGMVIGAPPNPLVNFNAAHLWPSWLVKHDPRLQMPKAKFAMVQKAVINACASPVGKAQGFVEEPDRCGFAPKNLLCKDGDNPDCLTAPQVRLMDQIYEGPVNPRTKQVIFPGPAKGGEAGLADFADGNPFPTALDLFRFAAFQDKNWDWSKMDWDKDIAAATDKIGGLLHVDSNLQPFFERGGKLVFYIGWNDYHNPSELIAYSQALMLDSGAQSRNSVRLFTVPGMGHCFGGEGCDTFNKLGLIDSWVDHGQAPEMIEAARVDNGKVVRTRPLCAYPKVPQYKGNGDPNESANFTCVGSTK